MQKESNSLVKLAWDSGFFGYGVGGAKLSSASRLVLEEIMEKAKAENIRLVYFTVNPADEISQESVGKAGGVLYDRKLTYFRKQKPSISLDERIASYSQRLNAEPLFSLSYQSGAFSRFRLDRDFKNSEFERLYQAWMENSVKRLIAKEVLVYEENGVNLGVITLGIKAQRIDIGLLAVDETARGKRIGAKLLAAADYYCDAWNCAGIQVVTQRANEPACRFYEQQGFEKEHEQFIYHLWL